LDNIFFYGIMENLRRFAKRRRELSNFFERDRDPGFVGGVKDNILLIVIGVTSALVVNAMVCNSGNQGSGSGKAFAAAAVKAVEPEGPVSQKPEASPEKKLEFYEFDSAKVTAPWLWILSAARAEGWKGKLNSSMKGLRTHEMQKKLWKRYRAGRGVPAFDPDGENAHKARHLIDNMVAGNEWNMAIDTTDVRRLIDIAKSYGVELYIPYSKELWHVEARKPFNYPGSWTPPERH
jgi:hypothetical protein